MKNLTLKSFCQKSHIAESLIRSAVRQVGGFNSFMMYAQDVCNHGAVGGFGGFIYYDNTVKFTKRNKAAILELCKEFDSQIENVGVISFIASFNCLRGESQEDVADGLYNPRSDNQTIVYNALAWFALEEVCRSYCDLVDSGDY